MNTSLADTLNELHADRDTLQQGLRLYMAEKTDDLTPDEMLAKLQSAAGPAAVEEFLTKLRGDGEALHQAALLALQTAWVDPAERAALRNALVHAKDKLPVIELGILAIVAMYGMYRAIPAQPTKVTTKITVGPGGKYNEEVIEEHEPFLPILSAFGKLFLKSKGPEGDATSANR